MKYLSNYMEEAQTQAIEKAGAFFAFGDKQFNEAKKEGVKYTSLGSGLIGPENSAIELNKELKNIYQSSIKQDIKENGLSAIIQRELGNYECQITGDITDAREALSDYPGITGEMILKEYKIFYDECVKNDWF